MARAKGKKVPPSRLRYEQNNPPVSFRVHKDVFERIQQARSIGHNSFADIFMAGLRKIEANTKKIIEAKKQGYDEGYQKGYAEAKLKYKITCTCRICGQDIEVTHPQDRQSVGQSLKGWAHTECVERKRLPSLDGK